jgi:hypothetical protein
MIAVAFLLTKNKAGDKPRPSCLDAPSKLRGKKRKEVVRGIVS